MVRSRGWRPIKIYLRYTNFIVADRERLLLAFVFFIFLLSRLLTPKFSRDHDFVIHKDLLLFFFIVLFLFTKILNFTDLLLLLKFF
jgi:hypothetical protein